MTAILTTPTSGLQLLSELMGAVRTTGDETDLRPRPMSPASRRIVAGRSAQGREPVPDGADEAPTRFTLDEVLRARHSLRFFTEEAIPVARLTGSIRHALQADRDLWPDPEEWATRPHLVVAALRVTGLDPGLYRYAPDSGSYVHLATIDAAAVAEMVLQREYAEAPAIVAAVGSVSDSLAARGEHGLRLLHTRAGGICYAALLAAHAHGIGGSVFAGFLASGLARYLDTDGYHLSQVFAVALGHPVPPTDFPAATA